MLVTSCFQERSLLRVRPSSSTVSVSVRVVPKNWRQGWLSFASCRFDIVTVLHFAAPKRTFQDTSQCCTSPGLRMQQQVFSPLWIWWNSWVWHRQHTGWRCLIYPKLYHRWKWWIGGVQELSLGEHLHWWTWCWKICHLRWPSLSGFLSSLPTSGAICQQSQGHVV